MTQAEAKALVAKHGGQRAAAKAAGMARTTFRRLCDGQAATRGAAAGGKQATHTLAEFRREHDQAWKIRDGLRRLFGGQTYMTDAEFREAVSGNPARWRAAADQSEFAQHRYRVGGELLWASKETIREMRKIKGEVI